MYSAFSDGLHTLAQISGISALVLTRRQDKLDAALEAWLLQQLRPVQLVHSLCSRKPLPDRLAAPAISSRSVYLDSLLELAFRVPPYLEAVDSIVATEYLKMDSDLSKGLASLENALRTWLKAFRASHHCLGSHWTTANNVNQGKVPPILVKSFFSLTCEALCQICLLLISECGLVLRRSRLSQSLSLQQSDLYAADLRNTTAALMDAASSPACNARAVRGPLHFLNRYYTERGDQDGLQWCVQTKDRVCKAAPYLYWDGLLPQTLMALTCMPG